MLAGKRIVVTGGCGFIGSHLVEALWKDNEVIVLDNLSSGKLENIKPFQVNFQQVDVAQQPISEYLTGADYVFHTAANISIEKSYQDPLADLSNNVQGTLNVLEACRLAGVKNVIYSSSSAVYSNRCSENIHEDDEIEPANHYGVSKLMGEYYARLYSNLYTLNVVCLRYFNVYGPRQNVEAAYSGVVTIFADRKLRDAEFIIFGDGQATRDFIYVTDVVKGNLLAALNCEQVRGQVYNIGTGKGWQIIQLANWFQPKKIVFKARRDFDVEKNSANIDKARRDLGFYCEVDLYQGLQMYWEYMAARLEYAAK